MRATLQEYILKVHQAYGLTTILVSHDITEIARMSDRVMVIEEGQIISNGNPAEIFPDSVQLPVLIDGKVLSIRQEDDRSYAQIEFGPKSISLPVDREFALDS